LLDGGERIVLFNTGSRLIYLERLAPRLLVLDPDAELRD
jgi:hypothetical protein